jgi:hypothetical protein
MKQFILEVSYFTEEDLETSITFRPSDPEISDYLATSIIYKTYSEAVAAKDELLTVLTPRLFEIFQQMENIPLEIRNGYYLS